MGDPFTPGRASSGERRVPSTNGKGQFSELCCFILTDKFFEGISRVDGEGGLYPFCVARVDQSKLKWKGGAQDLLCPDMGFMITHIARVHLHLFYTHLLSGSTQTLAYGKKYKAEITTYHSFLSLHIVLVSLFLSLRLSIYLSISSTFKVKKE